VVDRLADQAEVLFLNLFAIATQRNDLTVLPHSCTTALIGDARSEEYFGASNFGEFFLVSIQPPKLFHSVFY
jgi:hypothetical protein